MGHKQVLLPSLTAGFLGLLVCCSTAWAQQMSPPEPVQAAKEVTLEPNSPEPVYVYCPEGTKVVSGGGGAEVFSASYFSVVWSVPLIGQAEGEGWSMGIVNRLDTPRKGSIFVYALCSKVIK
jgi:hypothetical protein